MKKNLICVILLTSTLAITACSGPYFVAGAAATAGTSAAAAGLTTGEQIDDQMIKSKIIAQLENMYTNNQFSSDSNVAVVVFDYNVLLVGQAQSQAAKDELGQYASNIHGVKRVYNQIKIGPKQSWGSYLNDAWITSKVKGNFIGKVNPFHIKVVTEDGVVYLLGRVPKTIGDEAAVIASRTKGVREVVKIFIAPEPAPSSEPKGGYAGSNAPTSDTDNTVGAAQQQNSGQYAKEQSYQNDYQVGSNASD